MTRNSPRLSDDYTRTRQQHQHQQQHSRPSSQHSHHLPSPHTYSSSHQSAQSTTHSPHPPTARHSHRTSQKSSKSSLSSQNHLGSSPLKMVSSTASSRPPSEDAQYYYLPEVDVNSSDGQHGGYGHAWMEPIVIDDEDLMFGGKSLSAWYEEERQSLNYPIEEEQEERRGRQRIRQQHHYHHHHQHHEHHHHHHPHHHLSSGTKNAPSTNDQKRH
ncbi:hypothetical protein F4680DRAFT_368158 [Xylaria scruposa]|nr:hypothetical protein F4680DRAFT_368158 [Xylaria scruposa]